MLVILFAGFMPVPGGMGVAEAGYTAGFVALGIPHPAAMSAAIAYRLVTYYLPPIWGGISMKWLRKSLVHLRRPAEASAESCGSSDSQRAGSA